MRSNDEGRPVVVGVDAANPGHLATAWAADEADRRHAQLRLVHAVAPMIRDTLGLEGTTHHKALLRLGDVALDEAAAFARGRHPKLDISTVLADEYPAWAMCTQAAHAQLVVLGSRRLRRMDELLSAGSVTVPVSAQAPCPVVVVSEPEHVTQQPPYLVVGVDGSSSSEAAVDFAFQAAALRGATLRALWVWQPPVFGAGDEQAAIQQCRLLLSETTAGRNDRYPEVTLAHEVVRGHPVEELARASEHALAVVVGRRGTGGFTGMRLGSVPHGLLRLAHCPVVTVPAALHDGP